MKSKVIAVIVVVALWLLLLVVGFAVYALGELLQARICLGVGSECDTVKPYDAPAGRWLARIGATVMILSPTVLIVGWWQARKVLALASRTGPTDATRGHD